MNQNLNGTAKKNLLLATLERVAAYGGKAGVKMNPVPFAEWAGEALSKEVAGVLEICRLKHKTGASPQEKAEAKARKRDAKALARNVSWLKLDGVRAGGYAVRRGDSVVVAVLTDPRVDVTGERIVMDVKGLGKDGITEFEVDAMLYRPHFSAVHELQQTAAPKAPKAPKAKSGKGSKTTKS